MVLTKVFMAVDEVTVVLVGDGCSNTMQRSLNCRTFKYVSIILCLTIQNQKLFSFSII